MRRRKLARKSITRSTPDIFNDFSTICGYDNTNKYKYTPKINIALG
ncbi:MAG: hypothetical protein ABSD41_13390 [Candidatus Bathyarchaeia archaeon]